jgi:hypothetical protein
MHVPVNPKLVRIKFVVHNLRAIGAYRGAGFAAGAGAAYRVSSIRRRSSACIC